MWRNITDVIPSSPGAARGFRDKRSTYSDYWTHRVNHCDAKSYKTSTEMAEGDACFMFCSNSIGG